MRTKVAAVMVVLALAGLAGYAMFSGPTTVPVPSTGAAKTAPSKSAPPAKDQFPEGHKVHEQVALAALVAIGAHGVLLLGDAWLKPGITGITIPFTLEYRPLWTGLGIVAGYLALLLGPTYYWRRRFGSRRWRQIHRATVVVFVLAVAHSLGSGTDGASTWFRVMVLGSAAIVLALVALRYTRAPRRAKARRPASRPAIDASQTPA